MAAGATSPGSPAGTTDNDATSPNSPTGQSGGASEPAQDKPKSSAPKQDAGGGSNSDDTKSKDTKGGKDLPRKLVTIEQKELYRQAKIVCGYLTLKGLAHEYEVAATPDAVAHAYTKTYGDNVRDAAFAGCKAGVLK